MDNKNQLEELSKFLFEISMLKRTLRTGYAFLGTGVESTASHSFNTALIAFILGKMTRNVSTEKLLLMALIHDIPEARVGDANAVHKKYLKRMEHTAFKDAIRRCSVCNEFLKLYEEYEKGESLEAKLVRDADQIDMLLSLKEQLDCGNENAKEWIPYVEKRLQTDIAQKLAQKVKKTHWASWWMEEFKENPS